MAVLSHVREAAVAAFKNIGCVMETETVMTAVMRIYNTAEQTVSHFLSISQSNKQPVIVLDGRD